MKGYCVMCDTEVVGVCYMAQQQGPWRIDPYTRPVRRWMREYNKYLPLFGYLLIRNWYVAD